MSTDNPTAWWHSDKPARHIMRHEDGSEVELSEDDLDAMMRRWDQAVREMKPATAEQRREVECHWDLAIGEMGEEQ